MPFIRRQAHTGRIDVEAGIAAIQIEAAQGFEIARSFCFWYLRSPTGFHHGTSSRSWKRDQFVVGEAWLPDVLLLNLGGDPFREHQLQVDTVARQRRDHGFHRGAVFTDAVVEVFSPFSNAGDRGAVERLAHPDAGGFGVLLEHVILTDLLPEKVMLAMVGRSLHPARSGYYHRACCCISKLPVANKARMVLLMSSSVTVSPTNRHVE